MIQWKRENIHKLISLFGDGLEHPWLEVMNLGTRYFLDAPINKRHKTHQDKFEEFFAKGVNYGLIEKIDTKANQIARQQETYQISEHDYKYKITKKGDALLRYELAIRSGDAFWANVFDRTIDGAGGLDRFAPIPKSLRKTNE
jgi:hypothetical protein